MERRCPSYTSDDRPSPLPLSLSSFSCLAHRSDGRPEDSSFLFGPSSLYSPSLPDSPLHRSALRRKGFDLLFLCADVCVAGPPMCGVWCIRRFHMYLRWRLTILFSFFRVCFVWLCAFWFVCLFVCSFVCVFVRSSVCSLRAPPLSARVHLCPLFSLSCCLPRSLVQ